MEGIVLETAIDMLLANTKNIIDFEDIDLFEAVGRVSAADVNARFDNPPFDRSPLDGYALNSAFTKDATASNPAKFKIVGEECAGDFYTGKLNDGEALRIMTGAAMPAGSDCVIRQEDVTVIDDELFVPYELKHHENYCFSGEDIKSGNLLIKRGQVLNASRIAVLASQGFTSVKVNRKPSIAIASTGDELLMPGTELTAGKIYNSNLYFLAGRLKELGFDPKIIGILPDDANKAAAVINEYKDNTDLFITTGGVSVGKKDIIHDVVKLVGQRIFWRVLMKPGAPVVSYTAGNMLGIALSGNPFAAYATFELLVRPVLEKLSGRSDIIYRRCEAELINDFPKESRGRRFIRARYENGCVTLPDQHASGSLFSAADCNALIDIPAGTGKLTAGTKVNVVLLY
ncbi:MAG: molybdopterin molybdotransferase MoeA [Selenomonadaceae bacterium]|nr:molybdopterin molybdotransferase MoeA [Selenomonadaceae bacterium]